jgi:hypothetical protein
MWDWFRPVETGTCHTYRVSHCFDVRLCMVTCSLLNAKIRFTVKNTDLCALNSWAIVQMIAFPLFGLISVTEGC